MQRPRGAAEIHSHRFKGTCVAQTCKMLLRRTGNAELSQPERPTQASMQRGRNYGWNAWHVRKRHMSCE